MAKVELSFLSDDLKKQCKSYSAPLSRVLSMQLRLLKSHSKLLGWKEWGGSPKNLGLLICCDQEIRQYNRDYRKMNKATDVLSFPTIEASDTPILGNEGYLGDMIISLETVQRAASRIKRPVTEEFLEVFIHGVLHLIGFDHLVRAGVTRADAAEMKSLQAELFEAIRAPIKKHYGNFVKKR
jgi:probable rRNA maturation factor